MVLDWVLDIGFYFYFTKNQFNFVRSSFLETKFKYLFWHK
jgi:hypothetical protein